MYANKLKAQGLGRMGHARVEEKFVAHLDTLEILLGSRTWLVGASRSIADIAVGSQLHEIVRTSHMAPEVTKRAQLSGWLARV
jgi:glutathione S-transferase